MTRRNGKSSRRLAAGVLALGLIVVGCGGAPAGEESAGATGGPDTFSIRAPQDWDSFDFQVDARLMMATVTGPAYDRMVAVPPGGTGYVPYLAESWEQTPTSITFTMREDAACEDGHILTAADAARSYQRWLDVEKRSGAVEESALGGLGSGPWTITVDDEFTWTIASETPYGNMMQIFSTTGVICPAGFDALAADPRALETGMYGSGPYRLVSAAQGDNVQFALREEWNWGPEGSNPDQLPRELSIRVVAEDTTAANQLVTGELDAATVQGPNASRLVEEPSLAHGTAPNFSVTKLHFNMRDGRPGALSAGAAGDVFREAVFTAVDPQAWNQAEADGRKMALDNSFRPDAECYNPAVVESVPASSIERAREILAGGPFTYEGDRLMLDGAPFEVEIVTQTSMAAGPEYLFGVMQQLGMQATLNNLEGAAFGQAILGGNFDIGLTGAARESGLPGIGVQSAIGPPTPDGGNVAATGFQDARVTELVELASASVGQERCDYWSEWQALVVDRHYLRPLVAEDIDTFSGSMVDGVLITLPKTSAQSPDFIHWISW